MRKYIDEKLSKENDPNTYFLYADMGHFPKIKNTFKKRAINCGCRETHMLNMAIGLALAGKRVFIYSVAGFLYHKAYDVIKEIRSILFEAEGSITIYNAGAGFVYCEAGEGHYVLDDICLLENYASIFLPASLDDLNEAIEEGNISGGFTFIRGGFDKAPQKTSPIYHKKNMIITTGTLFHYIKTIIEKYNLDIGIDILSNSYPKYNIESFIVIEDHQEIGGIASILRSGGFPVKAHLYSMPIVRYIASDPQLILNKIGFSEKEIVNFIKQNL